MSQALPSKLLYQTRIEGASLVHIEVTSSPRTVHPTIMEVIPS